MSTATDDLLLTLAELDKLLSVLTSSHFLGVSGGRSANELQFNGMQVIAFAALEDFLRRRAHEVVNALALHPVPFNELPDSLRTFIVEQTIHGFAASLGRTEGRPSAAQLEDLLYKRHIGEEPFSVSNFFFGRSRSNISANELPEFLEGLNAQGGWDIFEKAAALTAYAHVGAVASIFKNLSANRHRAAHGFDGNFQVAQFQTTLRAGIPLLAFSFDTCASQAAFHIRKSFTDQHAYSPFAHDALVVRQIRFENDGRNFFESRTTSTATNVKKYSRTQIDVRKSAFESTRQTKGESLLLVKANGNIEGWRQPIA